MDELITGIGQGSLCKNSAYFGVGEHATGTAFSSQATALLPDLATALHQVTRRVTALAHSVDIGTKQSTRENVLPGDLQF